MTKKELSELDAWIAEHVIKPLAPLSGFRPSTCPADALEVLKKCLETREMPSLYKLLSEETYSIEATGDGCCSLEQGKKIHAQAETLELAICLFAKKLFTR